MYLTDQNMDGITPIWIEAQSRQAACTELDVSANNRGNQWEHVLLLSGIEYLNS